MYYAGAFMTVGATVFRRSARCSFAHSPRHLELWPPSWWPRACPLMPSPLTHPVKKCGRGICSQIVWLKNPEDSRGRPLRDARNENTSMRDRPIIGLPLFANMVAIDSSSWQGSVYNPEEGKVYNDVKVT